MELQTLSVTASESYENRRTKYNPYTRLSKCLCAPDDYNPHTTDDLKMAITEYIRILDPALQNKVFQNTIRGVNVWWPAGDTLNLTCNYLYCNH